MSSINNKRVAISENPGIKFIEISITNNDEEGMRGIPPWAIWKAITDACRDTPNEMKKTSRGTKMIAECRSREMAENLCLLSRIQSRTKTFKVETKENLQLGVKQGAVYIPDVACCDDEDDEVVLQALKDQNPETGIESFRRLKKRDKEGKLINTGTLVIAFRSNKLPVRISVFYLSALVREFLPDPMRCFRCLRFGHTAKFCKKNESEKLCVNCGQLAHVEMGEKCHLKPHCVHCNSDSHNSAARQCSVFVYEKEIVQTKFKLNITWPQAREHVKFHGPLFKGTYANAVNGGGNHNFKSGI